MSSLNPVTRTARGGPWSAGTLGAGVLFGLLLIAALLLGTRGSRPGADTGSPLFAGGGAAARRDTTDLPASLDASRRTAIVRAAERVGPSVVTLSVVQTRIVQSSPLGVGDDFFQPFFRDM